MTRKKMIAAAILAASATVFIAQAAPKSDDLQTWLDFRLTRLETMLTAMQTAFQTGINAMLQLSDDIGEMADRILAMADKIVYTEELLAETLLALHDCNAPTAAGVGNNATVLSSPSEGEALTTSTLFQLEGTVDKQTQKSAPSRPADDFVLYASGDPTLSKATSIRVRAHDLSPVLARINSYVRASENDKTIQPPGKMPNVIYVAVRPIENGAVGGLSNTVMFFVQ